MFQHRPIREMLLAPPILVRKQSLAMATAAETARGVRVIGGFLRPTGLSPLLGWTSGVCLSKTSPDWQDLFSEGNIGIWKANIHSMPTKINVEYRHWRHGNVLLILVFLSSSSLGVTDITILLHEVTCIYKMISWSPVSLHQSQSVGYVTIRTGT